MTLAAKVLRYEPADNPDSVILGITASGDYTTGIGGDPLDLDPSAFADPNGIGVLGEPTSQPATPPSIEAQAIGGYVPELIPGATLAENAIVFYDLSTGAELASEAYPAAIADGTLTVKVPLR